MEVSRGMAARAMGGAASSVWRHAVEEGSKSEWWEKVGEGEVTL